MGKKSYEAANWLERGEKVVAARSSRAKYQVDGSIVTHKLYADFVLTNRRLAMLTGIFGKTLTTELRPEHLLAIETSEAFRGRGAIWRPMGRQVLVLQVRKDGKNAVLGIALPAEDIESWRAHLQGWLGRKTP